MMENLLPIAVRYPACDPWGVERCHL